MTSTTALMTFAEFEQMPEVPGKQELIDGELIEMPPAKVDHMDVSKRVYAHLFSGTAGIRAYFELGYRIGGGWLQPDVSVRRRDREISSGYAMGSPELAVEVLSPGNRKPRIERKITLYFAEGAEEVWVIDPSKRTMSVYRASQDGLHRTVVHDRLESKFGSMPLAELFEDK